MDQLHDHCAVIGEASRSAMAAVHPLLRPEMRASAGAAEDGGDAGCVDRHITGPADAFAEVDLSDALMDRLQAKISELVDLRCA